MRVLHASTRAKLRQYMTGAYYSYIDAVTSQKRIAGRYERMMVERQVGDMRRFESKDPTWGWVFDWDKAVAPLIWMAANLRFPDGKVMGKPIRLEPWQIFLIMTMFGWVDRQTHTRRFLTLYLEVPRKNGKSTLGGCIVDYMAFSEAEGRGSPCYIGATSLDQSGETFGRASSCLELAHHDGLVVANSKNNKVIRYGRQRIVAISAAPKDGKLSHCFLLDEYHQHVSNELRDSILSGNVSDPESLTMMITTAGMNLQGVCKQEHDKCVQILEGSATDERYLIAIYCPDEGDPVDNPMTWEKANPNWGVSVDEATFRSRYEFVRNSESDMVDFRTKNLNMWCSGMTRWANMPLWNRLACDPFDESELDGHWCAGGLDLAGNSDFAAFVLDFPYDDPEHYREYLSSLGKQPDEEDLNPASTVRHKQLYHCWIPADNVVELERQLRVPLRQWIKDGYITATPGAAIDYTYIGSYIEDCRRRYDLAFIACDKWKIDSFKRLLPEWFDDIALIFSQGMMSMSPSVNEFERLYQIGDIESGGNPVMRWMMSCAEVKQDQSGNKKIVKPNLRRSTARIDLVIAAIMANDTAITQNGTGLTEENLHDMFQVS